MGLVTYIFFPRNAYYVFLGTASAACLELRLGQRDKV